MNQEQFKQDRSLEKIAMNIVYQIGDVLEASVDKRQATNDKAIEFVQGFLVDLERVTRQEERVAERMRCVEIISKIISKSQFIDQFDLLEEAQKLILNQDDND